MAAILAAAPQVLAALEIASSLASLIMKASTQLNAVSGIIKTAQTEGRKFTPEEWAVITSPSNAAINELAAAIREAKLKGQV